MDMSDYNFSTKDIFDAMNKVQRLNRDLVRKGEELRAVTTKRIFGEATTQELSRVADEAGELSNKLMSARIDLKYWSRILEELKKEIDNTDFNAKCNEVENDVRISTARIFSKIDKERTE